MGNLFLSHIFPSNLSLITIWAQFSLRQTKQEPSLVLFHIEKINKPEIIEIQHEISEVLMGHLCTISHLREVLYDVLKHYWYLRSCFGHDREMFLYRIKSCGIYFKQLFDNFHATTDLIFSFSIEEINLMIFCRIKAFNDKSLCELDLTLPHLRNLKEIHIDLRWQQIFYSRKIHFQLNQESRYFR